MAATLARDDIRFISPEVLHEAEGWEEGFIFTNCTKFDFINFDF